MCEVVAERLENAEIEKGEENVTRLYQLLMFEGKTAELDKAMNDAAYRKELIMCRL